MVEPVAQHPDPPLQQALLVLRRVVLEVLGQVAEPARGPDRLDDLGAAGAFELGELGLELLLLGEGQMLGSLLGPGTRVPVRG